MLFFVRRFQLSVEEVVPIRQLMCCLFSTLFCFGFDGMGENYIFCRLFSSLLLWCLFSLLCCLFCTSCGFVFCLQMCASCRKAGSLRGWAFFFLDLCYPVFSFFLYENILYLHFSFPLVYLFFLFFSLFFLFSDFINMPGWLFSFFQIFFLFALFQLYLPLLFSSIVYLYIKIDV